MPLPSPLPLPPKSRPSTPRPDDEPPRSEAKSLPPWPLPQGSAQGSHALAQGSQAFWHGSQHVGPQVGAGQSGTHTFSQTFSQTGLHTVLYVVQGTQTVLQTSFMHVSVT